MAAATIDDRAPHQRAIEIAGKAARQHAEQGSCTDLLTKALTRAMIGVSERTFNRVVWATLLDTHPPRYDTYYIGSSRAHQAKKFAQDVNRMGKFAALVTALSAALEGAAPGETTSLPGKLPEVPNKPQYLRPLFDLG